MEIKNLAIIQARVGSTRLPAKVLLNLCGKKVIEHIIDKLKKVKLIDEIIVATSIEKNNLPLVKLCSEKGIRVYCGSEDDVLDRFYQLANLIKPQHIIRITADCPLHDSSVIDNIIRLHVKNKVDYTSNIIPPTYPDGLDTEAFTFEALRYAWVNAKLASEREHVTPYIIKHKEIFQQQNVVSDINYSDKRWTLDAEEDYTFINYIYNNLFPSNPDFGMSEIIEFLKSHPDVEKINSCFLRNEGYQKSLDNEQ